MVDMTYIPPENLDAVWPLVSPLIIAGAKAPDNHYTLEGLKEVLTDELWQLWVAWNGSEVLCTLMTEVYIDMEGKKVGSIRFISGKNRKEWLGLIDELEEQMIRIGVVRLEMLARKGWAKEFPDYRLTRIFLTKDLTNGRRQSRDSRHNTRHNAKHSSDIEPSNSGHDKPDKRAAIVPAERATAGATERAADSATERAANSATNR